MNKYYLVLCALAVGGSGLGCSAGAESAGSTNDSNPFAKDAAGAIGGGGGGSGIPIYNGAGGSMGASDAAAALPPEQEQSLDFLAPRAGANRVYVANPGRNTVTVIDSTTLATKEIATGDSPTYVATVPGQDLALVINVGAHTLSILRDDGDAAKGLLSAPLRIVAKANAIAIAPDGKHAVIWYDASIKPPSTSGTTTIQPGLATGSTQEVSVVTLDPAKNDKVVSMSVGYNPSAVVFSSDGAAAFVVTSDGISELRFATIKDASIAPFTPIGSQQVTLVRDAGAPADDARPALPDSGVAQPDSAGPSVDTRPVEVDGGVGDTDAEPSGLDGGARNRDGGLVRDAVAPDAGADSAPASATPPTSTETGKPIDVSVTPDGHYAIARREDSATLLLIDLQTRTVTSTRLSSTVTDLDMLPDGSRAFAVLRDESTLVRIDIPAGFTDVSYRASWPFEGGTIGSVTMSSSGTYALLYTTAVAVNSLVKFDLVRQETQSITLYKAIRAVAISPDEKSALVLHTRKTGGTTSTPLSEQEQLDRAYGYSLVSLTDGFAKLQLTPADPNPFAITPDSSYAFVLLRDDSASVRIAERISLTSFLVDDFPLGSPPNSIAALSATAHRVFVGQVHSEGRISFIDWLTGNVQSVTGFALNGRIQQ
jgi:YVTN family beta-propeller protein